MIKRIGGLCAILLTLTVCACSTGGRPDGSQDFGGSVVQPDNGADLEVSYAFGMILGSDLNQTGLAFNYNEFLKGFRDSLENLETRMSQNDAILLIQMALHDAITIRAEENRQIELDFLAANEQKPGVLTTSSGLQYEIIFQGSGALPSPRDMVEVHYEGTFLDGTVFDSSYQRFEPVVFPLDQVIPGWTEGIQLMPVGSTYIFYVPSSLAYGEQGAGNTIPPNATLIFRVELLDIK